MTADGHHILDPAAGATGLLFCKRAMSPVFQSRQQSERLAIWIVDGKPSVDLSPMSVMRFKDRSWSESQLQREVAWQYRHFYGAV